MMIEGTTTSSTTFTVFCWFTTGWDIISFNPSIILYSPTGEHSKRNGEFVPFNLLIK